MTDGSAAVASVSSAGGQRQESWPASVATNLARVRARIEAAGGDLAAVTIVAVTKGFGPDAVRAALGAGLDDLGDNYAQELLAKRAAVGPGAHWHFLGPVQRNKVGALAPAVDWWHSVDRVAVGEAIARHRPGARVLVHGQRHR